MTEGSLRLGVPPSFRKDIEGLRAVAVLLVVGFHAGVPGFANGFVGVDVFFVLSGFLINRQLIEEAATGRIDLLAFWARRARRLLPAAAVMMLTVSIAALFVLSPLQWSPLARETGASATFVANLWFLFHTKGYFESNVELRPLLHMWSLAVEEQFYFVWPVLLTFVIRARRSPGILIAAIGVTSLAVSALLSPGRPAAFFGPHTRVWELTAGAAVAVWEKGAPACTVPGRLLLVIGGALGLVGTVAFLDTNTAWPGTSASLPVFSTVALVVAGRRGEPGILGIGPLQWIGRLSYGWYLWHWPALRFAEARGVPATVAVVFSLVAAIASNALIENPVRHHRRLRSSPAASLGMGAALLAVVVGVAGVVELSARTRCASPVILELGAARRDYAGVPPCDRWREWTTTIPPECTFGDARATRTLLLLGDSHAAHWLRALEPFARANDARIVFSGVKACPAVPVAVRWDKLPGQRYRACDEWHDGLHELVARIEPWLVVASSNEAAVADVVDDAGSVINEAEAMQAWRAAVGKLVEAAAGHRMVVVSDVPAFQRDPIDCLATDGDCSLPTADALAPIAAVRRVQGDMLARAGVPVVDGAAVAFPDGVMRARQDGVVTYRDRQHLTRAFSAALAPRLGAALNRFVLSPEKPANRPPSVPVERE